MTNSLTQGGGYGIASWIAATTASQLEGIGSSSCLGSTPSASITGDVKVLEGFIMAKLKRVARSDRDTPAQSRYRLPRGTLVRREGEMGDCGKVRLGFDGVGGCLYIAFHAGMGGYLLIHYWTPSHLFECTQSYYVRTCPARPNRCDAVSKSRPGLLSESVT